jgi:hypothetical protein
VRRGAIRHDGDDGGIRFAERCAARRRAADFDLRERRLAAESFDDNDVARAESIFTF